MNIRSQTLILTAVCTTVAWSVYTPATPPHSLPTTSSAAVSGLAADKNASPAAALIMAKATLEQFDASMAEGGRGGADVATDRPAMAAQREAGADAAEMERGLDAARARAAEEATRAKERRDRILKNATRALDARIAAMEKGNESLLKEAAEKEEKAIEASHNAEHRINHNREVEVITLLTGTSICPP